MIFLIFYSIIYLLSINILLHISASILLFLFCVQSMIYLTINPHKFSHLSTGMLVCTWPMSNIVPELTLVDLSICPSKFTPAVLDIAGIFSIELITVVGFPLSTSLPFTALELSLINASVLPLVNTVALELAFNELTHICISIDQFLNTISIFQSIFDLSFIKEAIFVQEDCVSCLISIFKISHIFVVFLVYLKTVAVWFALEPFSIITGETIRFWFIDIDDLYCSLTVSHAVLEMSKVKIFLWDILKTKTILIALAWQIGLPLSKIESSMEIPNYIFVRFQLKVYSVFESSNN